jgi:hypothetical protein
MIKYIIHTGKNCCVINSIEEEKIELAKNFNYSFIVCIDEIFSSQDFKLKLKNNNNEELYSIGQDSIIKIDKDKYLIKFIFKIADIALNMTKNKQYMNLFLEYNNISKLINNKINIYDRKKDKVKNKIKIYLQGVIDIDEFIENKIINKINYIAKLDFNENRKEKYKKEIDFLFLEENKSELKKSIVKFKFTTTNKQSKNCHKYISKPIKIKKLNPSFKKNIISEEKYIKDINIIENNNFKFEHIENFKIYFEQIHDDKNKIIEEDHDDFSIFFDEEQNFENKFDGNF